MIARCLSNTEDKRDPDLAGAEVAMRRAAQRARQRARNAASAIVHDNCAVPPSGVRETPTFPQTHGYKPLPKPLALGELPIKARTLIWNVFYSFLSASVEPSRTSRESQSLVIIDPWKTLMRHKHAFHDNLPLDEWSADLPKVCRDLREQIEVRPFYEVFDLLEFVLKAPECPPDFVRTMQTAFVICRLPYIIDENGERAIIPSATVEEAHTVVDALTTLRSAGLEGSEKHLRNACESINKEECASSIRESIGAVESVARMLVPEATTLKRALAVINDRDGLHPALKDALSKLYGYTSDEPGLRHPLLDSAKAKVGMDEAVLMLGVCASFASYLWRKHSVGDDR